jgi:Short C-terminal domain
MFSVYANRLLFSPDNWADTSTRLLQNSTIRNETANYVVDQLYANVNVAGLLKSGLPPRLTPLAGPAAGALRNAAVQGVELALTRPRVQTLWANANRAADQTFVAIVNGGKRAVKVNSGAVTLNLASIVDTVAARLGLPANLGAKLPASVANLTVFKSNQLRYVQNGGKAVKGLALWLTILVPLLYALAIFLARTHRRRTLMTVGFAIAFAGMVGWAGRSILQSQVTNGLVSDASLRPAVHAVLVIATGLLGQIIGAFILVGLVVVAAAWFAGPARVCVAGRRAIAPFLRGQPAASFAITAAVMVLIFIWNPIPATGTPVGIIVFLALALLATDMLRRQTVVEFPDARPGDATNAMRARLEARRQRRHRNQGSAPNAPLSDQLERLAGLRDRGEITAEEYNTAKATLLTTAT